MWVEVFLIALFGAFTGSVLGMMAYRAIEFWQNDEAAALRTQNERLRFRLRQYEERMGPLCAELRQARLAMREYDRETRE